MPDAFSDLAKVTRSYIPAANLPARIDVPIGRKVIPEGCNIPVGCVVPEEMAYDLTANQSYVPPRSEVDH